MSGVDAVRAANAAVIGSLTSQGVAGCGRSGLDGRTSKISRRSDDRRAAKPARSIQDKSARSVQNRDDPHGIRGRHRRQGGDNPAIAETPAPIQKESRCVWAIRQAFRRPNSRAFPAAARMKSQKTRQTGAKKPSQSPPTGTLRRRPCKSVKASAPTRSRE